MDNERRAAADGLVGAVVFDAHEGLVTEKCDETVGVLSEALVVAARHACMPRRLRKAASSAADAIPQHRLDPSGQVPAVNGAR